jgi:hypothetical protein
LPTPCDSIDPFKLSFELAKRLLASTGNNLRIGSSNTFVFLLDMNDVFESNVYAALREHFGTVEKQKFVGTLSLHLRRQAFTNPGLHVARRNRKYKHLACGHKTSLRFGESEQETTNGDSGHSPAGRVLNAADVRQLTVYAKLLRFQQQIQEHPNVILL